MATSASTDPRRAGSQAAPSCVSRAAGRRRARHVGADRAAAAPAHQRVDAVIEVGADFSRAQLGQVVVGGGIAHVDPHVQTRRTDGTFLLDSLQQLGCSAVHSRSCRGRGAAVRTRAPLRVGDGAVAPLAWPKSSISAARATGGAVTRRTPLGAALCVQRGEHAIAAAGLHDAAPAVAMYSELRFRGERGDRCGSPGTDRARRGPFAAAAAWSRRRVRWCSRVPR